MSAKVHVHMHVSDLAKSREFYEKFFGVAPVKVKPGYVKFLPEFGPVNLALSQGSGSRAESAVDHLGVQVDSPAIVRAEFARVKAAGLPVREEMGVNCCHANQDKFWVQDPDGVEWEVYHLNYDLEDDARARSMGSGEEIRNAVQKRYAEVAKSRSSCCGEGSSSRADNPVTSNLYAGDETAGLPGDALEASRGCGNPVALAELCPGEVVLDLGSGGGLDVLLSARRVGPTGRVYGLDMTDEMLALARANQAKAGVRNVEFLKGEIEAIPLPDASVDAIISNCVINLSTDKPRVFAEAFRVLRPGGRFAVHDIVVKGPISGVVRRNVEAWAGCLAGALDEDEYRALLVRAGFEAVSLEPTRVYRAADVRPSLERQASLVTALAREGRTLEDILAEADGKFRSAFVRRSESVV